jgi:geranylgeranyl diphosphate synthase type II
VTTAPPAIVNEVMRDYGAVIGQSVRQYLDTDDEPRRYLYDLVADYPGRGGKMMRPSLCIAVARALGAPLDRLLVAVATSIELMHNAMLVHDDIEDESDRRRGKPTLHSLWGVPMAINAGDVLGLSSLRPLLDVAARIDPLLGLCMLEETERMARESAEGQALELGWRAENAVALGEGDYFEMVLKKTCWLATIHPVRMGASVASGGRIDPTAFIGFGFFLGAAFQIQDDILNLASNEATYEKDWGGDLREGKRTLMIIRLLELTMADDRARLVAHLGAPILQRTEADVRWIRERMDHHGCIDYARQVARAVANVARDEYERLFASVPPSRDREFIEALITWVSERTT